MRKLLSRVTFCWCNGSAKRRQIQLEAGSGATSNVIGDVVGHLWILLPCVKWRAHRTSITAIRGVHSRRQKRQRQRLSWRWRPIDRDAVRIDPSFNTTGGILDAMDHFIQHFEPKGISSSSSSLPSSRNRSAQRAMNPKRKQKKGNNCRNAHISVTSGTA